MGRREQLDPTEDLVESGAACQVMETRLERVRMSEIDGHPIPPRSELKPDALRNAEAALRKAALDYRRCEVTSGCGCVQGSFCKVSEKEKRRKGGWKDAGPVEIEAQFTFAGGVESHLVKGVGEKQVRFLSGTCCRNEIIRGKG